MKKSLLVLLLVGLFISCSSLPIGNSLLNQGHFPQEETPVNPVTVYVDKNLIITGIDDSAQAFVTLTTSEWKEKDYPEQQQVFTIEPGLHRFSIKYSSKKQFTTFAQLICVNLEPNKEYKIVYSINSDKVTYSVIDNVTKETVPEIDNFTYMLEKSPVIKYVSAVLDHTGEGNDKNVILENDEYKLTYKPEMEYEILDKNTKTTKKGYAGFITDMFFSEAEVYLYETDKKYTTEEFLELDYKTECQIIFSIKSCDENSVTYTYVQPEEKAGQTITFNISVEE